MGATTVYVSFPASSSEVLQSKFRDYQEEKRYERGNDGYGGHMGSARGLSVLSKQFDLSKKDDAYEWLENNTSKFDSAKAVKIGDFVNSFPKTAAEKKLVESQLQLSKEVSGWSLSLLKRVKSGKSVLRACEKCASKIAVKFLNDCNCPVCGKSQFLATATDFKQEKSVKARLSELNKKIEIAKKKYEGKPQAYWLVGATVAE